MTIFTIETGTSVFNWGSTIWEELEEVLELIVTGDFKRAVPRLRDTFGSIPYRLYDSVPIVRSTADVFLELLDGIRSASAPSTVVPPPPKVGRVSYKKTRASFILPKIRK